jgi:selenocysteine lyase/cysteine desulfurase
VRAPAGLDLEDLRQALASRQVVVSVRGDAIRVAPSVYNDTHDLAALVDAVRAAVSSTSNRR